MPRSAPRDTAQQILDIAAGLVQTRGFNAFSYADIAAELEVTKASLHYHYPTKSDLGRALIERYERAFAAALADIDAAVDGSAPKLRRYAGIYAEVLQAGKMCMCGMLAAEYGTLPEPMQRALKHFFDVNERWLVGVLEHGRERGELRFDGAATDVARTLVDSLEGAMMLARSYDDASRFGATVRRLLAQLGAPPAAVRARRGAAAATRKARRAA